MHLAKDSRGEPRGVKTRHEKCVGVEAEYRVCEGIRLCYNEAEFFTDLLFAREN